MSATLFIADLHLDAARPQVTDLFVDFLAGEAREAEALYVLGDLFEAWLGDDDPDPHHARVADALHALAVAGVPVYFLVGNRDFLLGEAWSRQAGMTLLHEPVVLDLHGTRTVILHGDVLCTDDKAYQTFRGIVRIRILQKVFLALPLAARRGFAGQLRKKSHARNQNVSTDITDVNNTAVADMFRKENSPRMIHGHTHRPAIHELEVDGKPCQRIVLGDWYTQGSVLRVNKSTTDLVSLPLI